MGSMSPSMGWECPYRICVLIYGVGVPLWGLCPHLWDWGCSYRVCVSICGVGVSLWGGGVPIGTVSASMGWWCPCGVCVPIYGVVMSL